MTGWGWRMAVERSPALVALVGAAAAVVTLAGLRAAASIVGPIVLAMILTIGVSPLRAWLTRRRAPFWVRVAVPLATLLALLLGLGAAIAVSVAQLAALLPGYTRQFNELLNSLTRMLASYGVDERKLSAALGRLDPSQLFVFVQGFLNGLLSASSAILLVVLMLFGMCLDAPGTVGALDRLASSRPALVAALRGFARDTTSYLVVSTVFGAIVAVFDVIVLYAFGVPLPLLWGLLSFLTNYIPNIGFVIGLAPPAVLGLLEGGLAEMFWIIVAYSLINFVLQSLIQPKFQGGAVGMSFTMVSISLILWAWVLGPLGALLAVPLSSLTRALLIDADPSKQWVRGLIGSEIDRPGGTRDARLGEGRGGKHAPPPAGEGGEGREGGEGHGEGRGEEGREGRGEGG
ncbi:AI-2E family transporter [Actinomadura viridis]|uniref:AI-2E family transporter n=1 Tax=Actinomadura viridis TaxID=58110 RepID=UPI0036860DCC